MKPEKPCVTCGKPTKYNCVMCLTDWGNFVPLCENHECRAKHELRDCSRTTDNSGPD